VDHHFRTRQKVETLRADRRYVVLQVRGDLHALDLEELQALLQRGDALYEGNPFVGRVLLTHPGLVDVRLKCTGTGPLQASDAIGTLGGANSLAFRHQQCWIGRRNLIDQGRAGGIACLLDR
jgi:hypothetical protein